MTTPHSLEEPLLKDFEKNAAFTAAMNRLFGFIVVAELFLLVVFFPFLLKSALFALALAALLLTTFGYLLLRQYFTSQKQFFFEELVLTLVQKEKEKTGYEKGNQNSHVHISKLCTRIAEKLYLREYSYYKLPKSFSWGQEPLERLSAFLHWEDVFAIRELLLKQAAEEHLLLVRANPTSPDAHALLANAYVMLSGLYMKPHNFEETDRWIPRGRYNEAISAKFKTAAEKAIEEFKILKQFAPNDPWIYSQLAYSYRDLKMPEEERSAYEAILELRPNDLETLFKLGNLYFQQGENARGLKVYEELKRAQYGKADELLSAYGRST